MIKVRDVSKQKEFERLQREHSAEVRRLYKEFIKCLGSQSYFETAVKIRKIIQIER